MEVLNDLDGGCVAFWTALRDHPADLERACALTPYAREEYEDCRRSWRDQTDLIEKARRWWAATEQSCSGVPSDSSGWSISSKTGTPRSMSAVVRTARFQALAQRVAGVYIENRPAVRVIEQFATERDAVIYCDPPYVASTRNDSGAYRHEMTDVDHRDLADVLRTARATVLLSGYHCALYDELYGDWPRDERTARVTAGAQHGQTKVSTEVVWMNRELRQAEALHLDFAPPIPSGDQ